MEINAPAKVNLFLEVINRRKDGYHNIETIFQTVNIFDRLIIEPYKSDIIFDCDSDFLPKSDENLALKAALKLKKATATDLGARITLNKHIPLGAGLGGGSSDAAAVLRGLKALWKLKISEKNLLRIACSLGADVPFFLYGGTCIGSGIGQKIKKLKNVKKACYLLVYPGFPLKTADIYQKLHFPLTKKQKINKIIQPLTTGESPKQWGRYMFNRLEEPVFTDYPEIRKVKCVIDGLGYRGVMSGSGSTVFAIIPTLKEAKKIKEKLKKFPWKVFVAESVS